MERYVIILLQMKQQSEGVETKTIKNAIILSEFIQNNLEKRTVSLPLEFEFLPVELLSKQFTKLNNNHQYRIHYLGPRFYNTLAIHKKFAFNQKMPKQSATILQGKQSIDKYRVDSRKIVESFFVQEKLRVNTFYKSNMFYRAFQGMNPTLNLQKEYIFNSIFESGNLDCVIKIKQTQFDLFLRIDSNTKGHVQWFYFSVKNGSKKQKIKFNICNLSKAKSLYQSGMQPYVYSRQKKNKTGVQWEQQGNNLGVSKKQLRYDYLEEKVTNLSFYCLELQYEFEYQNDQVFFAYCVPYTFSQLMHDLNALPKAFTKQSVLGRSLSGIQIPVLHITNHQQNKEKKNILITGRMHPGESNSSHMLSGFIQFLNSNCKEANELRNRINFFIIPMVNPDGVIIGNTRTSAAGKDLNRQFLLANRQLYPQVSLIKEFARKIHNSYGIFIYLDFHGHSRKKNTFFYGPAYSISEPNYYKARIFPKLIQKINSNFRFHSCSFGIDQEKKQTARGVMFQQFKIGFTFTIQTSIGYFYDCQNLKTTSFSVPQWKKIGISIAQGLQKFVTGYEEYENIMKERRASRQKKRPPTSGKYLSTESKLQADQDITLLKKIQPLKIVYNDKSLFGGMIQQLKFVKSNSYIKELDDDCESDAHDEAEDFEQSKMREFNNLLSCAANVDSKGKRKEKQSKTERAQKREQARSESMENLQSYQQELKYLQELQFLQKPSTIQTRRQQLNNKNTIKKQLKNSQLKRTSLYRTAVLNNYSNKEKRDRNQNKLLNKSIEKKMVSESELGNQKQSYFGEYHLFVQKTETNQNKLSFYQKTSVFRRQKSQSQSRKGKRQGSHIQQNRFLSQSYLQKPGNRHLMYQTSNNIGQSINSSFPKKANYQFKFDQIQTALVAKQKLRDYLRTKINRSNRGNVIGPASFYGIRQNLNMKISNRKKFFQQQKNAQSGKKQTVKVLKIN